MGGYSRELVPRGLGGGVEAIGSRIWQTSMIHIFLAGGGGEQHSPSLCMCCQRLSEGGWGGFFRKPGRPEDVLKVDADEDGAGGDDGVDGLRQLGATKARAVVQRRRRGWWSAAQAATNRGGDAGAGN